MNDIDGADAIDCADAISGDGGNSCADAIGKMVNLRASPSCPWTDVLNQIPLSDRSFISGSSATWLAERSLLRCEPDWTPNDIDVFVCLPSIEFEGLVSAFMSNRIDAVTKCSRYGQHQSIIDVTIPGSSATVSFIRCPAYGCPQDVVHEFDINICTPIVTRKDDMLWVRMTPDVADSIRNRRLHCNMQKRHTKFMQYPLQRTLHRVGKYVERGYLFASMTFQSTAHIDFPEHDAACTLNIDDFVRPTPLPDVDNLSSSHFTPISNANRHQHL